MITLQKFKEEMQGKGWCFFPSIISHADLNEIKLAMDKAHKKCEKIRTKNNVNENTFGTLHHLLGQDDVFLKFLDPLPLLSFIEAFFQELKFILNSYGGVINVKNSLSYVGKIHRDIRTFSGHLPLMLNFLLMVDDFTLENGATYFLNGSHQYEEKPEENFFFKNSARIVGPAGSIVLFNSNLWHAAGKNNTLHPRRALTLTFTAPFFKQQMDYPRVMGWDKGNNFSPILRQIIGYNSRVPTSLEEWYQPPDKRTYLPHQG